MKLIHGGDNVGPELRGIIITAIQGNPAHRPFRLLHPCTQKHRLPKSSRCGKQCKRLLHAHLQFLEQSWTSNEASMDLWYRELCCEKKLIGMLLLDHAHFQYVVTVSRLTLYTIRSMAPSGVLKKH